MISVPVGSTTPGLHPRTLDVFGLKVTPLTRDEIIGVAASHIATAGRCVIANQNLHAAYLFFRDPLLRELHERSYVHADGMPIVWLARLAGHRLTSAHRVTYLDLMGPLLAEAARSGWRLYYLGGSAEVVGRGLAALREQHPGLVIEGHHGFFDQQPRSPETETVVAEINRFRPDILVVGMGMPRQEHWVLANIDRLATHAVLLAGAYLDYQAGAQPVPPRWLGPLGLEWLHRLVAHPRRLWRRYLVEPWLVLWSMALHCARRRLRP
jgi:N-acetylglucosaminyldiphosphoundecaprenol N-acetyl-beta-D-mannosaminyltransferase